MRSSRYEVKMTCDEVHLPDVRAWVNLHPAAFLEAYPPRQVNSLYFDTIERDCMNDNLIGVSERTKLRFRWYGEGDAAVQGMVELKRKSSQLGWKEHYPIPVKLDLTSLSWSAVVQQLREQVTGPFAVWLSAIDQPTLINSYMREYYESMDRQVRVTVDSDLKAYEQVMYSAPNLAISAPIRRLVVVEVKSDSALHRRVSDVLSLFPLQVGRNSKYVSGVTESMCFL